MPEIPDPTTARPVASPPRGEPAEGAGDVSRRKFYAIAANALGAIVALVVAVPGVAYLLDPLRRKAKGGEFRALPVTLKELPVGVPRQFPIIDERQDAWVEYPPEPVGSVWLVRESEGPQSKVVAFTSECPHLGCAVNLSADGRSFFCPCHASAFKLDGARLNETPPRGMDTLEVDVPADEAAPIRVKFQRFRTQSEEKIPLV